MESSVPPGYPTGLDPVSKYVTTTPGGEVVPAVPPTPAVPASSLYNRIAAWVAIAISLLSIILTTLNGGKTPVVPLPPLLTEKKAPEAAVLTFGWINDADKIKASVEKNNPTLFGDTPAGRAVQAADGDVYLWRAVRKAAGRGEMDDWYPNINQKDVGCCVGCGWKHATDVCAANQVVNGKAEQWRPVSVEVIYGGSRVEVGGGQINGDGSLGGWAAEWISKKGGVAEMKKYASYDLTEFSPARARVFGRDGVPNDIETEAKNHPVKGTALVKTWEDVNRSIRQGYPVAVCSNRGFTMTRDAQGFGSPQGTWNHCMAFIAVRDGNRPGAFCLNSWGDGAHTGPKFPADMPVAGFWVDAKVVEYMVAQGDSYALSDLQGFPARKLDWFFGNADPGLLPAPPKFVHLTHRP